MVYVAVILINIIAKCYSANCQLLISIDRFLPAVQRANFEVENTTYWEEPGEEEEEKVCGGGGGGERGEEVFSLKRRTSRTHIQYNEEKEK